MELPPRWPGKILSGEPAARGRAMSGGLARSLVEADLRATQMETRHVGVAPSAQMDKPTGTIRGTSPRVFGSAGSARFPKKPGGKQASDAAVGPQGAAKACGRWENQPVRRRASPAAVPGRAGGRRSETGSGQARTGALSRAKSVRSSGPTCMCRRPHPASRRPADIFCQDNVLLERRRSGLQVKAPVRQMPVTLRNYAVWEATRRCWPCPLNDT